MDVTRRRLKIVHVHDQAERLGGAERYLEDLIAALAAAGQESVRVGSTRGRRHRPPADSAQPAPDAPEAARYHVPPYRGFRRTWRPYQEILERERPDVVHLHNTQYFVSPSTLSRLVRLVPMVRTVHDVRPLCPTGRKVLPRSGRLCERRLGLGCVNLQGCFAPHRIPIVARELRAARAVHGTVVSSGYLRDELILNGYPACRIRVIPCFTNRAPGPVEPPAGERHILAIGRLARIKGMPQLLEALAHLGRRGGDWTATLVITDPAWHRRMLRYAHRCGLGERVDIVGARAYGDLDALYRRSRVVVVPSMIPEAFGLVGIEAMAFGRPVVAFDAGGIREWLEDGVTGFCVPRGDVAALADRIARLLADPALARIMGEQGRQAVDARYRASHHLEALLAVYAGAVAEHAAGPLTD
ncbi:MAG: glycosyltransferase family 4 protein [Planctomycetes bacterium]|nr:glycosyltransferase family 4 protein [Planctomycetota bacterium]